MVVMFELSGCKPNFYAVSSGADGKGAALSLSHGMTDAALLAYKFYKVSHK